MEEELQCEVKTLEAKNGTRLMMNDQPYSVYIKRQKDEYGTKKDAEKKERVCYGF